MSGVVAVLGASGFIGRHVVRELASEHQVRAVARDLAGVPAAVEARAIRDIADRDTLRTALEGSSVVVHLVGRAHRVRERGEESLGEFRRADARGMESLAAAAAGAGVRRIVYVSSVAAAVDRTEAPVADDVAPAPRTPYGISKLEAERALTRLAEGAGLEAVILRPPMVFGEGMKGNPLRLMQLVARGIPVPIPMPAARRSTIYVGNLALAIRAACAAPGLDSQPYFVADPQAPDTAQLARTMGNAMGRPVRLVRIPRSLLAAAGRVGDIVSRVAPFPLTTYEVGRLTGHLELDATRFWRDAGIRPRYSLDEGMQRTAAWFSGTGPSSPRS